MTKPNADATPYACFFRRLARSLFNTELKRNEGVYEADMQLVLTNALATACPC